MEVFSHCHPRCKLSILGQQRVGYIPRYSGMGRLSQHCKFNMDTLQLPGLHTLTTSLCYTLGFGNEVDEIEAISPLLLSGLGLKHLCILDWEIVYLSQVYLLAANRLALVPHDILYEYPRLHVSDLLEMAILCPKLEELRLQTRRSMGNQEECEMYQALGTLPKLRRLFLDLDFDARSELPPSPTFETANLDALRQTFINAAMDEKLALKIWKMIKNKDSRLRDLRLLPFGNRVFADDERSLIYCFARSYLLTSYNIEHPGLPVIEQIGKRAWEVKRRRECPDGQPRLTKRMLSVVHNIWPQVPEQSDWWTCWTSLPLQPNNCHLDEH
ncbi:hypothetical protein N7454_001623 [Penicillium verhagenii]|nr:hypothetical protein N7454_001623 [Penicillium verhagenii]